eukprot:1227604-Alexandrium_andersonii.AAC.1
MEMKMLGLSEYPTYSRVMRLLDGMRLPESAIQSVMVAAGNKYEWEPVTQALLFLYPPTRT